MSCRRWLRRATKRKPRNRVRRLARTEQQPTVVDAEAEVAEAAALVRLRTLLPSRFGSTSTRSCSGPSRCRFRLADTWVWIPGEQICSTSWKQAGPVAGAVVAEALRCRNTT